MPNNTENIVAFEGDYENITKLYALTMKKDDDDHDFFDCNAVVPMPEDLNIVDCSRGYMAAEYLFDCACKDNDLPLPLANIIEQLKEQNGSNDKQKMYERLTSHDEEYEKEYGMTWREMGTKYYENYKKYGFATWYRWKVENWGTKWGAYETEVLQYDADERYPDSCYFDVKFQTAWAPPMPIYRKLHEMFPSVTINAYWSDEGDYERGKVYTTED